MSRLQELEALRAKKQEERAATEEQQYEKDLEALIELEEQYGSIASVKVSRFVPGQPTRAFVRTPTSAEYKRYKDLIFRAASNQKTSAMSAKDAQEQLAKSCWVYPPLSKDGKQSDEQAAMLEAFPGLLTPLSMAASTLAEGQMEEEGKG